MQRDDNILSVDMGMENICEKLAFKAILARKPNNPKTC